MISDFSWWEALPRFAPVATAVIALLAALIALGTILVQRVIARRRASIDFFLKTEIDPTAIELYEKFKTHAPSMHSIPNTPLGKSEYAKVRAWLNICELIAVGVRNGAFSESVSFDYWGDVIPGNYQTAKELIEKIRTTPGEGSQHTYEDLEKLAERWARGTVGGSMRRGFFRLWLVLSIIWIAGGTWLLWDDLTGKLRPEELAAQTTFNVPEGFVLDATLENVYVRRRNALELILLPPFGLLALGGASFWIARGFKS